VRPEPRVERDLDVEAQLRPSIGRVGGSAAPRGAADTRSAPSCAPKTGKTRPHFACVEIGVITAGRARALPKLGSFEVGVVMAGRAKRAPRPHFASREVGVVMAGGAPRAREARRVARRKRARPDRTSRRAKLGSLWPVALRARGTAGARSAPSCAPKTGKTRPHSVCVEIGVITAGRAGRGSEAPGAMSHEALEWWTQGGL